jgi:hypothetical protein
MSADSLPSQMRSAAMSFLADLDGKQRNLAARPFTDDAARRWLEYRPRQELPQLEPAAARRQHRAHPPRPGASRKR